MYSSDLYRVARGNAEPPGMCSVAVGPAAQSAHNHRRRYRRSGNLQLARRLLRDRAAPYRDATVRAQKLRLLVVQFFEIEVFRINQQLGVVFVAQANYSSAPRCLL